MTFSNRNFSPIAICVVISVQKVLAEICDDGMRCSSNKTCCKTGCCYDDDGDDRYTYGYRLSIWNMWYFWFVVLFVLMSCFGGCGYYKQRQRVLRNQHGLGNGFLPVLQVTSHHHPISSRIVTLGTSMLPPPATFRYSSNLGASVLPPPGPASFQYSANLDTDVSSLPPPYSEVMDNPSMFPSNIKSDISRHTDQPCITVNIQPGGHSIYSNQIGDLSTNQMPSPPPYSEATNQNTAVTQENEVQNSTTSQEIHNRLHAK